MVGAEELPSVLIAEDDDAIRRLVALALRRRRIDVQIAVNGKAAIEALKKRHFDAVLLDLMMPEVSGWEIIRWLGEHSQHCPRSVIVMSAADRDALRNLDPRIVNAIIFKPFDVVQLGGYIKSAVQHDDRDRRRARVVKTP